MTQRRRFAAPGAALLVLCMTAWLGPPAAEAQDTPEPPINLHAEVIEGHVVTFRWLEPTGGLTPSDYVLEGGLELGEALVSISVGSTLPIFQVMMPDGAYYVRAYTLSGESRSVASNEIRVFVNQPIPPSRPSNLLATVNGSSVSLTWHNTLAGGIPESLLLDVTGDIEGSLPLNLVDSITFDGVPGGNYAISLRAVNSSGASSASNVVEVTFPSVCSHPPEIPADFLAFNVGNILVAYWESPASGAAPTRYTLSVTGTHSATLTSTERVHWGAVPPGEYNLSVRSENACGAGEPTAVQTVVVP